MSELSAAEIAQIERDGYPTHATVLRLLAHLRAVEAREQRLAAENDRLTSLLDRDQSGLASAIEHMVKVAGSRAWIAEGRGSYEWNDDDYRKEAGWALQELIDIGKQAISDSGDRRIYAWTPDRDRIAHLEARERELIRRAEEAENLAGALHMYFQEHNRNEVCRCLTCEVVRHFDRLAMGISANPAALVSAPATPVAEEER